MRSLLITLYLVCFGCYILYTRTPDFFDGETTPGTVHWMYDSTEQKNVPKVVFRYDARYHIIDAQYILRNWKEGKRVQVIYEKEDVSKAAPYVLWGYWLRWQEIIASIITLTVLFQMAAQITKNPSPESVIEQLEFKEEKKRKYLD